MKPNFDFQEKFGHIGYFMTGGGLKYECNATEKIYNFPEDMSESDIESLQKKSLADNTDYILELVQNNEFVMQEEEDLVY